MANTYSQIYYHIVFAVKGRSNLISIRWQDELYKYITGIVTQKDQKLMYINGMPDHIHLLVSVKPDCLLSNLVRDIKASSSKWINSKKMCQDKFQWQTGFGAFSVSQSQLELVTKYLINQKVHHKKKSFRNEFTDILKAYEIEYDEKYLFD